MGSEQYKPIIQGKQKRSLEEVLILRIRALLACVCDSESLDSGHCLLRPAEPFLSPDFSLFCGVKFSYAKFFSFITSWPPYLPTGSDFLFDVSVTIQFWKPKVGILSHKQLNTRIRCFLNFWKV